MADLSTSKFERRFLTNSGNPLLGATIDLIPQSGEYPAEKITLTEHPTRKGWYYKDAVPMNEYKIYINGSLYTQNIFHAENILKYIRSKFNDLLRIPSSTIENGSILLEDLHEEVRDLVEGSMQKTVDETITGRKEFTNIVMSESSAIKGFALPISPPATDALKTGSIYWDTVINALRIAINGVPDNYLSLDGKKYRTIFTMDSRHAENQYLNYDESLHSIFKDNEGYEILSPLDITNAGTAFISPFVKRNDDQKMIINLRSRATGFGEAVYDHVRWVAKIFANNPLSNNYSEFSSINVTINSETYVDDLLEIPIGNMANGPAYLQILLEVRLTSLNGKPNNQWLGIQRAVVEISNEN